MLGTLHQVEVDGNRRITTVREQLHVVRLGKVSREKRTVLLQESFYVASVENCPGCEFPARLELLRNLGGPKISSLSIRYYGPSCTSMFSLNPESNFVSGTQVKSRNPREL